jgi:hypothetical protein
MTASNQEQIITSVRGWCLNNPCQELFVLEDTGEVDGCNSETCMHYTHSARESISRLVIKEGSLELLGKVQESPTNLEDPMNEVEYYKIVLPGENGYENILRVVDMPHYGKMASILNRVSQGEQYNRAHMDIIATEKAQREEEEEERNRPVLTQEQRDEMRQRKVKDVEAIKAREPRKPRAPRI